MTKENFSERIKLSHLSVEVTRKCNLKCRHCCRGKAEKVDMDYKYIDLLLNQVSHIYHLTFTGGEPTLNTAAMTYFVAECIRKNVEVNYVSIFTNGINIDESFINFCMYMHNVLTENVDVVLSDDQYHKEQKNYNDSLLSLLPFYRKASTIISDNVILKEGRGENLKEANMYAGAKKFTSVDCLTDWNMYYTLNAYGEIINGIDWAYKSQKHYFLCKVEDLLKFHRHLSELKIQNKYSFTNC